MKKAIKWIVIVTAIISLIFGGAVLRASWVLNPINRSEFSLEELRRLNEEAHIYHELIYFAYKATEDTIAYFERKRDALLE